MADLSGEIKLMHTPKPFQQELFEKALKRDIIIHARTGSGKTFISVMLMNSLSNEIEKPYSQGGKRTIFLANTVPLVKQQAEFLRKQTHFEVGEYYGEKKIVDRIIDLWEEKIWNKELENNQILVMTPKIFENMIDHSFIELEKVNLVVFDECHYATGKHSYNIIMQKIKNKKKEVGLNLRILGLTASIVKQKCNLNEFFKIMKKLEETFECKIETSSIILNENESIKEQNKSKTIFYDNGEPAYSELRSSIKEILHEITQLDEAQKIIQKEMKKKLLNGDQQQLIFSSQNENPFNVIKKECSDVENILEELGLWSFGKALQEFITRLELINNYCLEPTQKDEILKKFKDLFEKTRNFLSEADEQNVDKIFHFSSDKLQQMLSFYLEQKNTKFHSIIFVERKSMAYFIDLVLKKLAETDTWSFIKSDYISSISGGKKNMNLTQQENSMNNFRKHKINVLVATSIIEEGIDVPACNLVIRFSKIPNFGSYIQSKGRARSKDSIFAIMMDKNNSDSDLEHYVIIEKELTNCVINDDNDTYLLSEQDELEKLDSLIKPYKKGNCSISCTKAIDLINRYCSSLENNSCGVLYPIYCDETIVKNECEVFRFNLRLPPNSVLNKTIQSDIFQRKKWAKMDAALKMCIELDNAGELAENLTILSKEDWLNQHYNLKEHIEQDEKMGKKVGSRKLKRDYTTIFADDLIDNKVVPDQECYLYTIFIRCTKPEDEKLFNGRNFGFLSLKKLPNIPIYKLYNGDSEFPIIIVDTNVTIKLNQSQYELLKQYFSYVLRLLRIKAELNFDDPAYGTLLVVLKPKMSEIDWEYLKTDINEKTAYEYFIQNKENGLSLIKDYLWLYQNKLVSIIDIENNLNPLSEFPRTEFQNFKLYFKEKYSLETTDDQQPLVEVKSETIRNNFIQRGICLSKKEKKQNYKILLIMEHLNILPIKKDMLFSYSMIPAIFYRLNSLLKVHKLQLNIENELKKFPNLKNLPNEPLSWDNSLKFNKIRPELEENLEKVVEINLNINSDEESIKEILDPEQNNETKVVIIDKEQNLKKSETLARLIIKKQVENGTFPNMFNILQCVTLKSACDNFDLERYEILGDCFLKLTVVMKIYTEFANINEGRMANLKSARVSNNYLYRLAAGKNLNEYIICENFMAQQNWIPPNLDKNFFANNPNYRTKLSDKSMADCVEALIGIYLIQLGTDAAKSFIEWLGFKISDQKDNANLNDINNLPAPTYSNEIDGHMAELLTTKFKKFEELLCYEFRNKLYLLQALTHPSDINNHHTSSYQKLEFIGDAVLDILVTQHIFQDQKEHSPGELTDLRQALVNNKFFANLAVKYGFHKYLTYSSKDIYQQLQQYLNYHELYPPDNAYLRNGKDLDWSADSFEIETPKFLADIFESVAGAIYLDSNLDLQTVWNVYFKMLEPYIASFKENIPCSPIKALYQLKPQSKIEINISENTEESPEKKFDAILTIDGESFSGTGGNKTIAKTVAYKKAVLKYSETKVIFF